MIRLTLLEKCYGRHWSRLLRAFGDALSSFVQGLEAQVTILGKTREGWIQVEVSGLDAPVVTNYLHQRFGVAPASFEEVKVFSGFRGKIIDAGKVGYGLYVDIGIAAPRHIDVLVPLHVLRSQLARGKKLSLTKMAEAFPLYDNFPLEIQVTRTDLAHEEVEGRLSARQSALFEEWVSLDFDRIVVLGACFDEVTRVVKRVRATRDVIRIIQLGFLEQLLLCKLGTDGPGIIKKMGPLLPQTPLHCFTPTRTRKILRSMAQGTTISSSFFKLFQMFRSAPKPLPT